MQNIFQGLPLRLFPEEVSVLLHHSIVDLIVDNPHPQLPPLQRQEQQSAHLDQSASTSIPLSDRALVFEHLWTDHRFFIAPGMKFGGDYLLYRNDPLVCHASLVASVKEPDEKASLSLLDLASNARLVSTVQKQHLLCSVLPSQDDATSITTGATAEFDTTKELINITPTASGINRRVVTFAVEWAGF
jgi:tRNA-intron lyase